MYKAFIGIALKKLEKVEYAPNEKDPTTNLVLSSENALVVQRGCGNKKSLFGKQGVAESTALGRPHGIFAGGRIMEYHIPFYAIHDLYFLSPQFSRDSHSFSDLPRTKSPFECDNFFLQYAPEHEVVCDLNCALSRRLLK